MNLRLILQAFGFVEEAKAGKATYDGSLPIWGESDSCDQVRDLNPKCNAFVRNAPKTKLRIQRSCQEKSIIFRVKLYRSDKIIVFETAQAFASADVPQSDSLVHRG